LHISPFGPQRKRTDCYGLIVTRRSLLTAALIDLLCVVVFVVIGRKQHDEGSAAAGIAKTAAPFLIALVVGWLVARPTWNTPRSSRAAVTIWSTTVAVGMLLRRFAFDRGTAVAFVMVATIFLGVTMFGWRFVARQLAAKHAHA
jgi:Protein of unknown function (DUF3054)